MDRIRPAAEAPAVLAGALAAFPLLNVLALLATTRHVGELKVVSEGTDDHFWVDGGDLIDSDGGATGRLFDLACADDAWFTVTAATDASRSGARMALSAVVEHLAPRLAEWQALRATVPLSATARMSATTTLPEVHLRAEQWRVLSRLGGGRRIGDVVEECDGTPVDTLRLLRELVETGLVSIIPEGSAAQSPERQLSTHPGVRDAREALRGPLAPATAERAQHGPHHLLADGADRGSDGRSPSNGDGHRRPAPSSPDRPPRRPPAPLPPPPLTSLMPPPLVTRPWMGTTTVPRP